jgi:RNA polymerase-binding transcription factor DksA
MSGVLTRTTTAELREALVRERDRIALDIYYLAGNGRGLAQASREEGVTLEESRALDLEREERQRLSDVEAALERLATGTYGTCSECGSPIGEGRLRVVPWATNCWRCAMRRPRAAHWDG